jgi:hypothetical protein
MQTETRGGEASVGALFFILCLVNSTCHSPGLSFGRPAPFFVEGGGREVENSKNQSPSPPTFAALGLVFGAFFATVNSSANSKSLCHDFGRRQGLASGARSNTITIRHYGSVARLWGILCYCQQFCQQ